MDVGFAYIEKELPPPCVLLRCTASKTAFGCLLLPMSLKT